MMIRKARKKDLMEIAEIEMAEFSKPPFNDKNPLKKVLKSLNFYIKIANIYVAVIDNKIAGVIIFKQEQWWGGSVIIIEDLIVHEKYQKKGIGKKLINWLESYAKKKKVNFLSFMTNKKAISVNFYKKLGYKQDKNLIFMEKKLK